MKNPKNIDDWQPKHYLHESSRILGEADLGSDSVVHGAMMLCALREGADLDRVSRALSIDPERLRTGFDRLVENGVFRKDRKVCGSEWFEADGGLAFILDVMVADGMLGKARARTRSLKVGSTQ